MAQMIFNPAVFSGLILYVISTVLWLIALSKTTLNFAYPFTALTFALVMLSSRVIFLENIPTLLFSLMLRKPISLKQALPPYK